MHNIEYHSFDITRTKQSIFNELNQIADEEGDGGGLYEGIRWNDDKVFDSYDEALERINEIDQRYANIAVKYHDTKLCDLKNAKVKRLEEQIEKWKEKMRTYDSKHSISSSSSKTITCPHCGSKLNKEYLKSHRCPVCQCNDMRSKTVVDHLSAYVNRIKDWENDIKKEQKLIAKKAIQKSNILWLVKIEYHS